MKKIVYIASPYAGNIKKNVTFAKASCRFAITQGVAPLAVHLFYPQILDDTNAEERALGLNLGLRVLRVCDELWVCGEQISAGMDYELCYAKKHNIPIYYFASEEILNTREPSPAGTTKEGGLYFGYLG